MHTDHDPIDPKTLAEMGYEQRDVEPKSLVWPAAFLFGGTILAGIIGAFLIRVWHIVPEDVVEQRPFIKAHPPVGTPLLQNNSDATADIATLRRNEAKVLLSSGELGGGFYHIPIDTAITLMTQRGLPVTGTQTVTHPPVPGAPAGAPTDLKFETVPQTAIGPAQPRAAKRLPLGVPR